jgi:hypothetical protein
VNITAPTFDVKHNTFCGTLKDALGIECLIHFGEAQASLDRGHSLFGQLTLFIVLNLVDYGTDRLELSVK